MARITSGQYFSHYSFGVLIETKCSSVFGFKSFEGVGKCVSPCSWNNPHTIAAGSSGYANK